ncbi:hypothetical protein [Acinetobacter variabilis]|uniref:hypothetical protein n=1 Tax=Acinetobacter variabilis TaxID=70346 RepID=UPI0028AB0D2C|nr:hypothetical protein [Acinetobacter variabilis]
MYPDYYDSAESMAISRKRALEEIRTHGIDDTDEFYANLGDRDIYQAQEVLRWLGY